MIEANEFIKQRLKQFIEDNNVCVIATCYKSMPRASTVSYVARDFTFYIVTSGKSTKVRNIRTNPNVSIAIDDQGKLEKAGLQAEGIAKILDGTESKQAKEFYSQRNDISHHKPELVDTVLKIELKEIMFTEYTEGSLRVFNFDL